ncbi:hypothetical protein A4H97_33800 [Niastella yeongjuensis]|uniref:Bacteriophage T5 Orf172 DNA-binding domain-containing protein n=1 Tax=Niastella yeongjuensis TaxID=354355 RepID=A0A1V9ECG8_9BACT|nr:GIY-YIG nuclease family protein [Niastella yeongjuensis]OQP43625.1 hypothetical protein A4H97_33800 [Niastella yeongjuensis]SEP49304.1 T5orf172 domain-containing protein [Niastella yeongjuensis]
MASSADRQKHYRLFSSPTPDSPFYDDFVKYYKQKFKNEPQAQKKSEENFRQAVCIINTQLKNGAGLLVDSEFRYFLPEFNSRNFKFGFGSMPPAFVVLEGFFYFNKDLFLFELFPEEDYLFSSFDFIDFVTSEKSTKSIDYLKDSIEDNVIYSYNILNNLKEITFKSNEGNEFIFAGVSMIKRKDEINLFIVAGEKADIPTESKNLPSLEGYDIGRNYIMPADDRKREVVQLLNYPDFRKIFLYLRINLDTKTIDTRYIQKDEGNSFSTITDDYDMLLRAMHGKKEYDEYILNSIKELNSYNAILEVAYNCLYLPEYFDQNEDDIVVEEHPTALSSEKLKPSLFKKDKKYSSDHFFKTKDIWTLDKNNKTLSKQNFSADELKIEMSGYWKNLEIGQQGKDKKGNAIHNRTWVDQTLSWYESDPASNRETKIQSSFTKKGYIYILHNPSHPSNVFKIGLTTKTVEERASQLSGTPSVDKFLIAHSWLVNDCVLAEKLIHHALNKYRMNERREFFKIEFSEALRIIVPIIENLDK